MNIKKNLQNMIANYPTSNRALPADIEEMSKNAEVMLTAVLSKNELKRYQERSNKKSYV